jgi:pimeloyl-ACP methyl ester carboxylesterase
MAWNYRDYGRSHGIPDPYTCYHDSESILKFIIKDLGLIGKIGCFGRSLGGTMASHLANNFPEHIDFLFVDRSLGSLEIIS